jgi:hypothetical protein
VHARAHRACKRCAVDEWLHSHMRTYSGRPRPRSHRRALQHRAQTTAWADQCRRASRFGAKAGGAREGKCGFGT